jgi:5'-nucleotidase
MFGAACAAAATAVGALAAAPAAPAATAAAPTTPFVSEIHYDNAGTDTGEFVEVQLPPGGSSAGLSVVLYNGSGGGVYDTDALPAVTAPADAPAVAVVDYPSNGLQNGAPDGLALVQGTTVLEFLSYEGTLTATNGPAAGRTSVDIGVAESGSDAAGMSLSKRLDPATGSYAWQAPAASTEGTVNPPLGAQPPPVPDLPIAAIQGTGDTSPYVGRTVTTEGVVTAAYPVGGFYGYFLQTQGTGGAVDLSGRPASDGIFVHQPSGSLPGDVKVGNYVKVTGTVSEYHGLTELSVEAADVSDAGGTFEPVTPTTTDGWPRTDAERESLEGMLYLPTGHYTVTDTYSTNQYGEVGLAFGDEPLIQPTEVAVPGSVEAKEVAADDAARAVVLDDGSSTNFLTNKRYTPPYISLSRPVRVGARATFQHPVVVDYRNGGWDFQPTALVNGPDNAGSPVVFADTRTDAPDASRIGDAYVKVASFNVLNYFTTLGASTPGCEPYTDRDGNGVTVRGGCAPRGAWDAEALQRQQDKIVRAVNSLDADVVGLLEIENSAALGERPDEALHTLVDALNADAGAKVWAANPSSAELPDVSEQDVITSAIIYKPAAVTRVGPSRALGTQSGEDQAFGNAREPLGQIFRPNPGGKPFLFVVNHFKSKGSPGPWPGDADTGDGQGSSTESRVRQAAALRDWVAGLQAETGVESVALAGDFNSYTEEDPLHVLYAAGYTDAEKHFGHDEYSYSYSGMSGSLDHVLVNADALERATGADIWNINSPESVALEYSRYNYHPTLFYAPDQFRSSDHDPVIVGFSRSATTSSAGRG